jgi:hypothetical protein
MNPEPTLGDILAAALGHQPELPPISDLQAHSVAAENLSATLHGLGVAAATEAWRLLAQMPPNLLNLLESPQGWTALASMVAAEVGQPEPGFKPTVH